MAKRIKGLSVAERLDAVRQAVADAAEGLEEAEYRELMEELLADAEGWRMELKEREGE